MTRNSPKISTIPVICGAVRLASWCAVAAAFLPLRQAERPGHDPRVRLTRRGAGKRVTRLFPNPAAMRRARHEEGEFRRLQKFGHAVGIAQGWDELRKGAGVQCRLHDPRHTFATHLAGNGASESTMLSLIGI